MSYVYKGIQFPATIFLFFLLHAMSYIFYNTISYSLLCPVPSLPTLLLILLSLHLTIFGIPGLHYSYICYGGEGRAGTSITRGLSS
jgi:hypothetical protein